jgi:hypothetical protein
MKIEVPKPPRTEYGQTELAIEIAFGELLDAAFYCGLRINRPMGFMYLPTQKMTRDFQDACRAILAALKKPE